MVNPARAGMILLTQRSVSSFWSKPRASGDDPVLGVGLDDVIG